MTMTNIDHHRHYSRRPWPLLAIVTKIESGQADRWFCLQVWEF